MSWYAYRAMRPLKAAAELREAGYEAFCLMRMERRKVSRAVRKSTKSESKAIVALPGYVFVSDPDPWTCSKMRHVGSAIAFCGRRAPIPPAEMNWLLAPTGGFFHDTDVPRYVNRPEPPLVKAGDVISFTLAGERHTLPVDSVDGHLLLVRIRLLGRDAVRVPTSMVEAVEAAA